MTVLEEIDRHVVVLDGEIDVAAARWIDAHLWFPRRKDGRNAVFVDCGSV